MRTYAGLVLFQDVFNYIPTDNTLITKLANSIMSPTLLITETDCGTTLGTEVTVTFSIEGLVETSTGNIISLSRINQLLAAGQYEVYTRDISSCTSTGGVCATCYNASFPETAPNIPLSRNVTPSYNNVLVQPVYGVSTGSVVGLQDPLILSYNRMLVFVRGNYLVPDVDYTISGITLTLTNTSYVVPTDMTIRYYNTDNSMFLSWFSNTYSASVLGMAPLSNNPLPVSSLNLTSLLSENEVQLVSTFIQEMSSVPTEYSSYADKITDLLEKSLYLIILYTIYSNVISN